MAFSILSTIPLYSMPIYDGDDRVLSTEAPDDFRPYMDAVAASISKHAIEDSPTGGYAIISKLAGHHKNFINGEDPRTPLCDDEKFGDLPVPAGCSGFLVAPDLLLTAGHCVRDKFICERNRWVFGFEEKASETLSIPKDNLYSCKKILEGKQDSGTYIDYALIQLDRPVVGRRPLKLKQEGNVSCKDELMVVGHPYGLPLIFARNGYAHCDKIKRHNFYASLDSFAGNSGSPVINLDSGEVEGILTTGRDDYELDSKNQCYRPVQFNASGAGEGVVKLPSIYLEIRKYLR